MPDSCKKTTIGGQALIEGILMLGPEKAAIAIRKADGEIELKVEDAVSLKTKYKILNLPFIRGAIGLFESMKRGISALNYSASFEPEETDEEPGKLDKWLDKKFGWEKVEKFLLGAATVMGVVIPIVLFVLLPTLLAGFMDKYTGSGIWRNLLEGAIRIVIFLIFMFSVSRMKDMQRVFAYHGAEHKTIFCYEAGEELKVENVKKFKKEHPRCGTSFLFSVMIVSILVFSVVSWSNPLIRMALRLLLLPVVVGISYEINRFVGRHDNFLTRAIRAPGLAFQSFTTFEPDDSMIEIAIAALKEVIPADGNSDCW